MSNRPPDYCPYCGSELSSVDPPTTHRCDSCEDYVFYNAIPTARIAVVDGDSILLVKVDIPDRDIWGTPGGMVEADEDPEVTGARELEEETTLVVDADDLVLFDARTFVKFQETYKTSLSYAVDATNVRGTPQADDEVAAAQFWTPAELDAAEDRLLTSWPEAHKDLAWWIDNAREALQQAEGGN